MIKRFFLLLSVVVVLASCASQRDVTYLQDLKPNSKFECVAPREIRAQVDDMISIVVLSKNPELASMFNLPGIKQVVGATIGSSADNSQTSGYTVNSNGCIDFPILGEVYVEGQTREEVARTIKEKLKREKLINDPVVTVNFLNLKFYVLGEVAKPGSYSIEKNSTTILEALSTAGDLTIYGKRDKVFLMREVDGKKIVYQIDLRSKALYQSPAFYLQQNDMIYVEPNKVRANQSTVNGNSFMSVSFWMSLASLLTTVTLLFVN